MMKLLSKIPKDEKIIFVGDLVDRGPESKEIVSWVRRSGHTALMGNHEHMLIDFFDSRNPEIGSRYYEPENYYRNGGINTLKSYLGEDRWTSLKLTECEQLVDDVAWMRKLPLKMEFDDLIVTHAPLKGGKWSERLAEHPIFWTDLIWNRDRIAPHETKFQIFGHNGVKNIYTRIKNGKKETYAICIDDTRAGFISAVHWPTQAIIQEPFKRTFNQPLEVPSNFHEFI